MATCNISQRAAVLVHLREHGKISQLQALRQYGIMRLAAIIHRLRRQGHNITSDTRQQGDKRYAVYRLEVVEDE